LGRVGLSCNAQFLELNVTRDHKKVSALLVLALFYGELMQCKKNNSIPTAVAVQAHKRFANKIPSARPAAGVPVPASVRRCAI
jgi:hypothetical protein